ncbi:hypothetical protein [Acinetobacter baumannii]|uniref:hypothetical protein n=1 Tax=Acinetobacter baumannii TaxID=470 RepID=UPI0026485C35|nr:hypothetical protein [Acinetobacter baumannii]
MIDITSKILDLKLFEAEVIDIDETNHWENSDQITLRQSEGALIVLRINYESEKKESYSVSLEVDKLDSYGECYLNDSIWTLYGCENDILERIVKQDWSLKNFGSYNHYFK